MKRFNLLKGTSQLTRNLTYLNPNSIKISELSEEELFYFLSEYAKRIIFFGKNKTSDWSDFFEGDNFILLIRIARFDEFDFETNVLPILDRISILNNEETNQNLVQNFAEDIANTSLIINGIRKKLVRDFETSEIINEITNSIDTKLKSRLRILYSYKYSWSKELDDKFQILLKDWNVNPDIDFMFSEAFLMNQRQIDILKEVYNSYYNLIHFFSTKARKMLIKSMSHFKTKKTHIGLMMAFLKLYNENQNQLNTLTKKHLDYYYKDILQQKIASAVVDETFLVLSLKEKFQELKLRQGTFFQGAKNENNLPILFQTKRNVSIGNYRVERAYLLEKTKNNIYNQSLDNQIITGFFVSSFIRPKKSESLSLQFKENIQAITGYSVISKLLKIEPGNNKISAEIIFSEEAFTSFLNYLNIYEEANKQNKDYSLYVIFQTAFHITYFEGKEFLSIENYGFSINNERNSWIFDFEIASTDLLPNKNITKKVSTDEPQLVFELKQESALYLYSIMQEMDIIDYVIFTNRPKVQNILAKNNYGAIEIDKPFEVFGTIPKNQDYLIINGIDLFEKPITKLNITFHWREFPFQRTDFQTYFKDYELLEDVSFTDDFTNQYYIIPSLYYENELLKEFKDLKNNIFLNDTNFCSFDFPDLTYFLRDLEPEKCYFKFDLYMPIFGLGHEKYTEVVSLITQKNAFDRKKENPQPLPNKPFSLFIDYLNISVDSNQKYSQLTRKHKEFELMQFVEIMPFGYLNHHIGAKKNLKSQYEMTTEMSSLMLGINTIPDSGIISLLFLIDENFGDGYFTQEENLGWWYLENNKWVKIAKENVKNDTTNGLINNGVVILKIPTKINKENTILPKDFYWIKITSEREFCFDRITDIYENAIEVVRDSYSDVSFQNGILPQGTIHKALDFYPELETVFQPIHSFRGKQEESETSFYQRVSERLHHKNRAINGVDYEKIILEQFPIVYKVKCFSPQIFSEEERKKYQKVIIDPGCVKIVLIPDVFKADSKRFPRLPVDKLLEIKKYISQKTSPFVRLEVSNAYYEEVKVFCKVKFYESFEDVNQIEKLNQDIIDFIEPTLSEIDEEEFGRTIYKSEVLAFIQSLSYVRFVTSFSMIKVYEDVNKSFTLLDTARQEVGEEEIHSAFPWSVMLSVREHEIETHDHLNYLNAEPRGIGNMNIESDFIIG
ncbi:baseplate J/gp47 family protein [Aureivirga marina]|uniref:baseplate J/gp47 family protein n=1 Tax=Aureivirga marina TaxID=1182451 RepID=UPI0018CBE2D0|nr:baseplate J/gp47 family protein [Aureivirga marina]